MDEFKGFSAKAFWFLRELEKNNDRQWFAGHKEVFEEQVRWPMVELVRRVSDELRRLAVEYVPEKPEKAIYRIYRDTRFSKDKTPYKTQVSAMFQHRRIAKNRGAGLYFEVTRKHVGIAGGLYMPEPEQLQAVRKYMVGHWQELGKLCGAGALVKRFGAVQGESLARVPKGFEADSPAAEWLKRKQVYFYMERDAKLARSGAIVKELVSGFKLLLPMVEFLNEGILRAVEEGEEREEGEEGEEREGRPVRPEPMF